MKKINVGKVEFDLISVGSHDSLFYYNKEKDNMIKVILDGELRFADLVSHTPQKMLKYLENKLESEKHIYVDWFLFDSEWYEDGEEQESDFYIYYDFNPVGFVKLPADVIEYMIDGYVEHVRPKAPFSKFIELRNLTASKIIL